MTWRSWTKSYCVTPAGGTRWVKCMWCECMRMFPHLCFQKCDLPHRSWVTWLSTHTFSRYLNGPRWDDVRNTGTEPRAVEWCISVPPKCVLVPPARTVPGPGRWRLTSPESVMFRGKVNVIYLLSTIVIILCQWCERCLLITESPHYRYLKFGSSATSLIWDWWCSVCDLLCSCAYCGWHPIFFVANLVYFRSGLVGFSTLNVFSFTFLSLFLLLFVNTSLNILYLL